MKAFNFKVTKKDRVIIQENENNNTIWNFSHQAHVIDFIRKTPHYHSNITALFIIKPKKRVK